MAYLRWAKLHSRVRYELTGSGVPSVALADLDAEESSVRLEATGGYGDPRLIDAISGRYDVPRERIVPTPGASSANFIALAIGAARGDRVMIEHPLYEPIERVAAFLGLQVIRLNRQPNQAFRVPIEQIEAGLARGARAQ